MKGSLFRGFVERRVGKVGLLKVGLFLDILYKKIKHIYFYMKQETFQIVSIFIALCGTL
jgi:hypothetical protein